MATHVFGIAAVTGLIVFITVLPFLPGSYDGLAVALSAMARVTGFMALLLVPFGVAWALSQSSNRLAGRRFTFALAALIAISFVWAVVSVSALAFSGVSLAIATLLAGIYTVWAVLFPRLRSQLAQSSPIPLYLAIVPIAVLPVQRAAIPRAVEFARTRVIENSAPLIAQIERHRTMYGQYPVSILALWPDYKPGIIGVSQYHYERHGDAYNVAFEQPTVELSTNEIVVYNPRDEQTFYSHAIARLEFSGPDLDRRRGYFAEYETPHPHWKYYWFD